MMKFSILAISHLLGATVSAYTLTFYTDDACTQGAKDFSRKDFAPNEFGGCTNTGISALSFEFFPDVLGGSQQQNMLAYTTPDDAACQSSYDAKYDAFYQGTDATCIRTVDSLSLNGEGIQQFVVYGNDAA